MPSKNGSGRWTDGLIDGTLRRANGLPRRRFAMQVVRKADEDPAGLRPG